MSFKPACEVPFTEGQVVVAVSHGGFGSHVGIAFYPEGSTAKLLHLAWHKRVKTDSFPPRTCYIATTVKIPEETSEHLVGFVRMVSDKSPDINYGINVFAGRGSFDTDGEYTAPAGSDGLTCATFVTEIFRAASLQLIDENTWKESDENVAWGQNVVDALKNYKDKEGNAVNPQHIEAVSNNVHNGLRVRPEEVGAAADIYDINKIPPLINFTTASVGAHSVMKDLNDHCVCELKRSDPP